MNKKLNLLSTAIFCLVALTMTSCGDKNDPDPEPPKPVTYSLEYKLSNMQDLLLLGALEVTYTDAAGKNVTESLSATPWTKKIENLTLPFTADMKVSIKRKTGVVYDRSYKITANCVFNFKASNGTVVGSESKQELTVASDKIEEYLTHLETEGVISHKKTYTEKDIYR